MEEKRAVRKFIVKCEKGFYCRKHGVIDAFTSEYEKALWMEEREADLAMILLHIYNPVKVLVQEGVKQAKLPPDMKFQENSNWTRF